MNSKYDYYGYSSDGLRYVSFCNKITFLRTLDDGRRGTVNCIRERMSRMGNDTDINYANKCQGKMVIYNEITGDFLQATDLVSKDGALK